MEEKKWSTIKTIVVISIILAVGVVSSLYGLDWQFVRGEKINFADSNGEKLFGKYYSGTQNAGIIFLEGFGSDHIALKSFMSDFFELDVHMFVFDFSGQGRSSGILTFDNAATDRLANQVLVAKERFKALSGLSDAEIILLGHSMGARVALQAATLDSSEVAGLILLGTQLSLDKNIQSSFFTGVNDSSLTWVQNLSPSNPDVNILLLSGAWDDILPKRSAYLLYEKLSNTTVSEPFARMVTAGGKIRELGIYPAIFHNYEVYAPKIIAKSKSWVAEVFTLPDVNYSATKATARVVLWFLGIASLFTAMIAGTVWLKKSLFDTEKNKPLEESESKSQTAISTLEIADHRKYLWMKLLLLFASLPIAAIVCSLFFLIPLGVPVFNILYVGIFTGYGILLIILFRTGKMPATEGQWKPSWSYKIEKEDWWKTIIRPAIVFIVIALFMSLFARSGFFYVIAPNARLIWLFVFSFVSLLGFYIGRLEKQLLEDLDINIQKFNVINILVTLVPFFLQTIFFLILGSVSGFLGGIHGLIILLVVILMGDLLEYAGNKPILTAFYQAFLLQLLVLPQGSLFIIF